MKKIKVTMIRSKIREKNTTKKVLQSLGLKKIGQSRTYNYNDSVMGMVKKIIHLLKYEIIEESVTWKKAPAPKVSKAVKTKDSVSKPAASEKKDKTVEIKKETKKTVIKNETHTKPSTQKSKPTVKKTTSIAKKPVSKKSSTEKKQDTNVKKETKKAVKKTETKVQNKKKEDGGKDETQ